MHTNLERKTATSTFGLALITILASACATTAPEQPVVARRGPGHFLD